ncbi:UDP-N-acetylmuramoyl-tripeptide--D-alanyl-D-alanine ligase [Candidatus Bipolaricaulota bacterium]|nr:UDP-N-acetylmuramoyl-tripeptide--D-alanyl-D-alanine ligase [Candidatus Bipolaricaulota bacterium]
MFPSSDIARIVAGRLLRESDEVPLRAIHDSRLVQKGDLFVALKGARTDGHAFLEEAFMRGACGALVSETGMIPDNGHNLIVVEDTRSALSSLASAWRSELPATFVGITGTCGKTTTKAILAHILERDLRVFSAPHNYNTEIGLPLALLAMPSNAQVGIFELGASAPREIAPLAALLAPKIAILTMVGHGHLSGFGNVETITQEKWELVRALPSQGIAIINLDCPELSRLADGWTGEIISVGLQGGMVYGKIVGACPGLIIETKNPPLRLETNLLGRHNATNILSAVACALELGLTKETIENRMRTFKPFLHRLNLLPAPFGYLLDDTYNANPDSTQAALFTLASLDLPTERRGFVFGNMLDLGNDFPRFHHEMIDLALRLGIGPIFPVGDLATEAARGVVKDAPTGTFVFSSQEDLADSVRKALKGKRNIILVKGSRDMNLDRLVTELEGNAEGSA